MRTLFPALLVWIGLINAHPCPLQALEASPAGRATPLLRGIWQMFLSDYMTPDGRVIDTGNRGITHSEGQGYAMIMAVRAEDRASFDRIWSWTKINLWIREDDLFAWAWDPASQPHVFDTDDASDGNILIAWALLEGASLWHDVTYRVEAQKILEAVWDRNVVTTRFGPTLLPGARGFGALDRPDGPVVNLSYWVFPALERFVQVDKTRNWQAVIESGLQLVNSARFGPRKLPSDWISLAHDRIAPAENFPAVFGYDVIRVPLYLAWARPRARQLLAIFETVSNRSSSRPLSVVEVSTGSAVEALDEDGYEAIGALLRCVLRNTPVGRKFLAVKKERYYPTTLHILSLLAVAEVRPDCL